MSYSENVANFMHVLGPFYEAVYDGQEPENLRRESSPQPSSETSDKSDHLEDESGYSSSVNGTGIEDTGQHYFLKYNEEIKNKFLNGLHLLSGWSPLPEKVNLKTGFFIL